MRPGAQFLRAYFELKCKLQALPGRDAAQMPKPRPIPPPDLRGRSRLLGRPWSAGYRPPPHQLTFCKLTSVGEKGTLLEIPQPWSPTGQQRPPRLLLCPSVPVVTGSGPALSLGDTPPPAPMPCAVPPLGAWSWQELPKGSCLPSERPLPRLGQSRKPRESQGRGSSRLSRARVPEGAACAALSDCRRSLGTAVGAPCHPGDGAHSCPWEESSDAPARLPDRRWTSRACSPEQTRTTLQPEGCPRLACSV